MLPSYLYSPENVHKSRYAHIGVALLAVVICGYVVLAMTFDLRGLQQSETSLGRLKAEATELARQSRDSMRGKSVMMVTRDGGVELFAMHLANWASARGVKIESLTPEGASSTVDVKNQDVSIGQWTSQSLRVQGCGQFEHVMELLEQLKDPLVPAEMQSFSLQALNNGMDGSVTFQILMTVYEKKRGVV
jgi:hypothetical protein